MRITKKDIANVTAFLGVASLLGVVLLAPADNVPVGEMSYQKFWLSRMSVVFTLCCLFSLCLDRKQHSSFPSLVAWVLIALGGIEALWGLRQLYGLSVSHHSLYALTGSFYNPGPYSGYLAMVFPLCLHEWLQQRKKLHRTWKEQSGYCLSFGVLLLIVCVLPAGMSRSAWLAAAISGAWVYGMHASWKDRLKEVALRYKVRLLPVYMIAGIALLLIGYGLFHMKEASANGRLFMWKISCVATAESPVLGHGKGNFAAAYGAAQESYFAGGDYSETEELVAGSPEYAFNEYLQLAVEYGIPFLIAVLLIISFCLWNGIAGKRTGVCAGVLSVLVFSFSSYPMQIPVFAVTSFFLLAACVVERSRILFVLFTLIMICVGGYYWKDNQYDACKEWYRSKMLYNIGAYQSAREEYEKLYSQLKNRGAFLFEYGHSLHKLKEYDSSTKILEEAMKHSCDPMILNIIGKNYQAIGKYEKAEEYLLRSTHRLPGRIYPYYLLAKLYAEPEYRKPEKLRQIANIVLTKEPKVQSTAVREMREEVKKLLISMNL